MLLCSILELHGVYLLLVPVIFDKSPHAMNHLSLFLISDMIEGELMDSECSAVRKGGKETFKVKKVIVIFTLILNSNAPMEFIRTSFPL